MTSLRPGQFKVFAEKLMNSAPPNYRPWLIPCQKNNKAPETKSSWKSNLSRLTIPEAVQRLKQDIGNVGLAGRPDDRLILLDIDDPSIEKEIKPTLRIRSRSRTGTHAIYWAKTEDEKLPANIPTEKGELRSSDQYVIAPGSYVPCSQEELEQKEDLTPEQVKKVLNDPRKGYYTLDNNKEIATISFEELPTIFKQQYNKDTKKQESNNFSPTKNVTSNGDTSALYQLSITDLTASGLDSRDPHPLHQSETGKNWCITGDLGHCWRHMCSLNALQFLCVESGYLTCLEAGSPHRNSQGGPSKVKNNNEAIWVAWKHAKEQGYISDDDPIPTKAMLHIAEKHGLIDINGREKLPRKTYNEVIEIVEGEY